jgi:DNA repair protein RecN (Recombination protein N)
MKYGGTIESVFESLEDLNQKISAIENKEFMIDSLTEKINKYSILCHQMASELSTNRLEAALNLVNQVQSYFEELYLNNSEIKFEFLDNDQLGSSGIDQIELYVKTNLGDDFKPLSKVVSGGELSRIMLSLKTSLIGKYDVSTIIFDEIDTGVSGRVSSSFGELMKKISQTTQVMTITHLPTVAAKADHHYKVLKFDDGNETYTELKHLRYEEKN